MENEVSVDERPDSLEEQMVEAFRTLQHKSDWGKSEILLEAMEAFCLKFVEACNRTRQECGIAQPILQAERGPFEPSTS